MNPIAKHALIIAVSLTLMALDVLVMLSSKNFFVILGLVPLVIPIQYSLPRLVFAIIDHFKDDPKNADYQEEIKRMNQKHKCEVRKLED